MKHRLLSLLLVFFLLISGFPVFPLLFASNSIKENSFLPCTQKTVLDQHASTKKKITFQWHEQDIDWIISEQGLAPKIKDLSMRYIPGQPVVPYQIYHLELSTDQDLAYVRTSSLKSSQLPALDYPLQIAEKPLIFSQESSLHSYLPREESYSAELCFPEENFELNFISVQGKRSLVLFVYPLYTFQKQWYLARQISIEVGLTKALDKSQSFMSPGKENQAVILCPDELKSSAEELGRLQEGDGYKARVITLSEARSFEASEPPAMRGIYGFKDYPDSQKRYILNYDLDTALRIRTMLRSLLKEGKIHYLTILGDASYVPPSYYVAVEDGLGPFEMWLPTDYFYMAPNAKEDMYSFDINIGRLPVQSPEDAVRIVDKLRRYRKVLHKDWFKKASIMGGDPFDRDYFGEMVTNDAVNKDYFKGMEIQRFFRTEGLYSTNPVLDSFREGKHGFLWALGHGTGDALALEPGRVDAKDIMDLPKNDYLPVVVSESCVNGAFDSRLLGTAYRSSHHFKNPLSFSEAVMNSDGAGIAYVGGVRINFGGWIKQYQKGVLDIKYLYYTNGMVAHFFEAYAKEPSTLGNLAKNAMLQYMKEDWMLYYTHAKTFFGFTFQGDPTLRLPYMANDGKKSQPPPQLSYRAEASLSYDSIPYFSMDDGIQVEARSTSNRLNYIVADYLDQKQPLREKGEVKRLGSSQFQYVLKPDRKSFMAIRVQAEDFKETRIVYYARYNFDLVLQLEDDFTLLSLNESKDYTFRVANEGLHPARDIIVKVSSPNETIQEVNLEAIPPHSSHRMYFSYRAEMAGDYEIQMKAQALEHETQTSDNLATYPIRVSADPISRVGVLQASEKNSKEYYEGRLKIKELNAWFRKNHQPIEIFVTPLGLDDMKQSSMERLDIDLILLYTPYFYEEPIQELLFYLEQFEQKGGLVLGIMNLGSNQYGTALSDLQSYFGIQAKESMYMLSRSNSSVRLSIMEDEETLFSKNHYALQSRLYLAPGRSWKEAKMPDTKIIALSEDQQIAMTRYGTRYFYSGFISEQDLEQQDDSMLFLNDLLSIPLKDRMDLMIHSVETTPLIADSENAPVITLHYQNVGNLTASKLKLRLNGQEEFDLPALAPRSKASFTVPIPQQPSSGSQEILLELQCLDRIKDKNLSNNHKRYAYYFDLGFSGEKPEIKVEGSLSLKTLEDNKIIEGKVSLGSQLYINGQLSAVEADGTFSALIKLNKGRQSFEFQAKNGSLESDILHLEMTREEKLLLHLGINDPMFYVNYEAKSLGEATPFIRNSISYVPLRYISENFGAEISFEAEQQKVLIQHRGLKIHMVIGEMQATIESAEGSKTIPLQGPSVIVYNRTFVPIRFIAETFGAKVDWEPNLEMITITYLPDALEVQAPLMEQIIDEKQSSLFSATILDANSNGQLINPNGMDLASDGSLLITNHEGIYRWDLQTEAQKVIDFSQWQKGFPFNSSLSEAKDRPHPTLFRVWKDKLIYSDQFMLYLVNKENGQLEHAIPAFDSASYPYPLKQFTRIHDMQIQGNRAYILSYQEGLSIIDLEQAKLIHQMEIPYYPVAFSIYKETITIAGFYGHVFRLDLNKGELKLFDPEFWFYPQSLFQDKEKLYVQMAQSNAIHELSLRSDKAYLGSAKQLSTRNNYQLQQVFFLPRGTYGLVVNADTDESFVSRLNSNFAIEKDPLADTRKWLKDHPSFLPFIKQSWIVGQNQVLVSQRLPADESVLKLFSFEGKWIQDISIQLSSDDARILGIQYLGSQTLAVLIAEDTYTIQRILFQDPSRPKYSSTQLRADPKAIQASYFTANERLACIWDAMSRKAIAYDLSSGRMVQHFDLASANPAFRYFSSDLILRYYEDDLHVLDSARGVVHVFDPKGKILNQWDLGMAFQVQSQYISDMKVLDQHRIAVLDGKNARILFFDHGAVYYVYENLAHPLSMDIQDKFLLLNDPGQLKVTLSSLEDTQAKTPKLSVHPSIFSGKASYTHEWSERMVIQCWDEDSPLHIEHPEELEYEFSIEGGHYKALSWKLSGKGAIKLDITGKIIIRSENLRVEIPVNIKAVPVTVQIYSLLFKKASEVFYPGLPSKMDQGVLYIELFALEDMLPVTCKELNGDLMITMPKDTLIINTREGKATLMDQRGSRPFQLGAEVQKRKGKYLVPVNAIFRLLGLQVNTFQWPLTYLYPEFQ
jgi:hypothetical protein